MDASDPPPPKKKRVQPASQSVSQSFLLDRAGLDWTGQPKIGKGREEAHGPHLDVVEAVLRAVGLGGEHGEEVAHGLHLPHGLGVQQPRLDALCINVCVQECVCMCVCQKQQEEETVCGQGVDWTAVGPSRRATACLPDRPPACLPACLPA